MHTAGRRDNWRRGAWAALLAMLLLAIGPLLSQWLLPGRAAGDMPPGCSEHRASPAPASHGQQALWAKCGYCTLLFSSPALTSPALLLAGPRREAGRPVSIGGAQRVVASPVFPGARSRAPPALS